MVRFCSHLKLLSIVTCISALALLSSCTSKKGSATVQITMPKFSKAASSSSKMFAQTMTGSASPAFEESDWGLAAPSAITDFTCFGVMVGASESGMNQNLAYDTNGNLLFMFGPMQGLVGPGQTISLAVPSGPSRSVYVIGFQSIGGVCETLSEQNHEITHGNYSPPFILGKTTVDLSPGDAPPITIDATYTAGVTQQIGDVKFASSTGGGGHGSKGIYLGSGLDGDIHITSASSLATTMNYAGTQYLSTSAPVLGLATTANPQVFQFQIPNAGYSVTQFGNGDEVMLYVVGEQSSVVNQSGCEDSPQSGLSAGFRIPAKVVNAPYTSTNTYIDLAVSDSRIAHVPPANVTASAISAGAVINFCRLSITRVPQINKLTLDVSASLTAASFSGFGTYSNGGLLVMRVRDRIEINGTGPAPIIQMNSSGYLGGPGMNYPGLSSMGEMATASAASYGSGGGGSGNAAGGGHGGLGGGTAGGNIIGDPVGGCNEPFPGDLNMHCLMGKIFMGGGGGSTSFGNGGNGGGLIAIFANKIIVGTGQSLAILSNGATSSNGGGGAGGAILVRANNIQLPGTGTTFTVQAAGGSSTFSSNGGGGGGGRVHIDVLKSCNSNNDFNIDVSGGTGFMAPQNGNSGTIMFTGQASSAPTCVHQPITPAL